MLPETGASRDREDHSTSVAGAWDRRYSVSWLGPRFKLGPNIEKPAIQGTYCMRIELVAVSASSLVIEVLFGYQSNKMSIGPSIDNFLA